MMNYSREVFYSWIRLSLAVSLKEKCVIGGMHYTLMQHCKKFHFDQYLILKVLCHLVNSGGNTAAPMVDRTLKRPPQVNRAIKPRTQASQDHSYCNMAPPVDRQSKYKRNAMPKPEHSYINYQSQPRPQNLPLVRILNNNPLVGSLPSQRNMRQSGGAVDDLEYCEMTPTRSQWTRCYSLDKDGSSKPHGNDQFYEDMSAIQSRRLSGAKSSSSSSSSLAENDDVYTTMTPGHASSPMPVSQVKYQCSKFAAY